MKSIIISSFLVLSYPLVAQDYDSLRSIYVKEFPDHFNAKLIGTDRLLILNLIGREAEKKRVNYAPNDRGYIGLGAYIFDVGLELAVKVPVAFERSKTRYGETDFIDFQGNVYGRKWCFDGTFQKYDGFYVNNAIDITPGFQSGDNFPQREDLSVMNIVINGIHVFNHQKFSFRSGFNQADKQIKSAGSPILLLSASRFSINADSKLIPGDVRNSFGEAGSIEGGRFLTLSVLPGYAYNFVIRDFYINLNATGGIGMQHQNLNISSDDKSTYALEPKLNVRAAIGYDNDRFFAGGTVLMQRASISFDGMRINNTAGNFKFIVGMRFEEFGIFKKFSIRDINPF